MGCPIIAYIISIRCEHLPSTSHTWPPAGLGMHLQSAYHRIRNPICMHGLRWVCWLVLWLGLSLMRCPEPILLHSASKTRLNTMRNQLPTPSLISLQPSHGSSVQGCRSRRAPPDAHVPMAKGVVAWLRRGRSGCMLFETCLDVYPFGWSTVGLLSVEEVIDQPSVRCARPKSTDLEYASSKYSSWSIDANNGLIANSVFWTRLGKFEKRRGMSSAAHAVQSMVALFQGEHLSRLCMQSSQHLPARLRAQDR